MKQLWSVKLVMKTGKNMQIIVVSSIVFILTEEIRDIPGNFQFICFRMLNDLSTIDD